MSLLVKLWICSKTKYNFYYLLESFELWCYRRHKFKTSSSFVHRHLNKDRRPASISNNKMSLFVCNIFLQNHLLFCHDYPSLVQTFNTRRNINGAILSVSQLEQGGAWCHWSSSKNIIQSLLANQELRS